MPLSLTLETVRPRMLAAVRCEVPSGAAGAAWRLALDKVWACIRVQPGLWTDGHNVFVYHHPARPGAPMRCDFGVEVTRTFEAVGDVRAIETPAGHAVVVVYRGPYDGLREAHRAAEQWITTNGRTSAGTSWEIYGDPTPDPADTETTIVHLLT